VDIIDFIRGFIISAGMLSLMCVAECAGHEHEANRPTHEADDAWRYETHKEADDNGHHTHSLACFTEYNVFADCKKMCEPNGVWTVTLDQCSCANAPMMRGER